MDELLKTLEAMNALANAELNYKKTVALLRALKAGQVMLDQVTLTDDGWQVTQAVPPGAIPVPEPEEETVPDTDEVPE